MHRSEHGKVCYIELPTLDIERSATFYQDIFDWKIRRGEGGSVSFDDTVEVSGTFDTSRKAAEDPGFIVSIMVRDIRETIARIEAAGCEIVRPLGFHPTELVAHFRDPGGNLLGLYQEPQR
jgi:predicted enzyme related to lactoylglutathione lyase